MKLKKLIVEKQMKPTKQDLQKRREKVLSLVNVRNSMNQNKKKEVEEIKCKIMEKIRPNNPFLIKKKILDIIDKNYGIEKQKDESYDKEVIKKEQYDIIFDFLTKEIKKLKPYEEQKIKEYSTEIIINLIKYGFEVVRWKELKSRIDINVIREEIIEKLNADYRRNEIVIQAVFAEKVFQIENVIRTKQNLNLTTIYKNKMNLKEEDVIFDMLLFKEVSEKGNGMYKEYIKNPSIQCLIQSRFGVQDVEKQLQILKTRISYLVLLLNL